ncbi:DNA polymerase delta, subunit 4-domain-containing protein [Xylaria flabelliformis]|nr:DNA polymerase delta, subunit 4-domain-containing protein [Xylaria flabelliformis]
MPPTTRRSSGGGARSSGKQSTLSFNHRVTKPTAKSAKNLFSEPAKSPLAKHVINAEPDVKDVDVEEKKVQVEVEAPKQVEPEPELEKTEAELRADKITDRQISQYWRNIESERRTKRLHQEDLSLAEKILRYWDVSSQYGPCVGVNRLKRWQRANRLGLNPPVEVLAVLMKEETKGTEGIERAYIDDILNSTAVGAG